MADNIENLFKDILSKLSRYDKAEERQLEILKELQTITYLQRAMSDKLDTVHKWKQDIEQIVTITDLKDIKNKYSNIQTLEQKIDNLKKELSEEIRKDIKDLEEAVNDSSLKERLASVEAQLSNVKKQSLITGGGAGAVITAIATALSQYFK